jgi:hypothetical protein
MKTCHKNKNLQICFAEKRDEEGNGKREDKKKR